MATEYFYNYKKWRWFWINLAFLLCATVVYYLHDVPGDPRGSTPLGYTYGIIAALGICYLMWYGIRRRSYHAKRTTLKGVLAAHVWIGVMLVFLVPLHSGFSFGWNLHSVTYYCMVLTVLTGVWGAGLYRLKAADISSHRGGLGIPQLLEQLTLLSTEIDEWQSGKSTAFGDLIGSLNPRYEPGLKTSLLAAAPDLLHTESAGIGIASLPPAERESGRQLVSLINKKISLLRSLHSEVRNQALLKLWLYTHVPLSFACFALVLLHIYVALYYR